MRKTHFLRLSCVKKTIHLNAVSKAKEGFPSLDVVLMLGMNGWLGVTLTHQSGFRAAHEEMNMNRFPLKEFCFTGHGWSYLARIGTAWSFLVQVLNDLIFLSHFINLRKISKWMSV